MAILIHNLKKFETYFDKQQKLSFLTKALVAFETSETAPIIILPKCLKKPTSSSITMRIIVCNYFISINRHLLPSGKITISD